VLAGIAVLALPSLASAQSSGTYVPPKLAKPGASTSPITGGGSVTVQVFVKKDGAASAERVIKTTNAADNAAALEIAKTAAYTPATRGGKAVDAYYDYVVKFAVSGEATTPGEGPTAAAYADIRAGKYADAKAKLQAHLQAHPNDTQANTLLGVADAFSGDDDGAAAAFDNVPSIPQQYVSLAAQAYSKHATNAINASKGKDAEQAATRVIALEPNSAEGYYLRGVAAGNAGNFQAALPDLQKALDLAKAAAKPDDKAIATVEFSLAVAQLNTGAYQAGAATAKDVAKLDAAQGAKLDAAAYVAVTNAAVAAVNAGKVGDAVASLESGATLFPANAANFYGYASYLLLTDKSPDYKRIKAEADKALAIDPANGRALLASAFTAANSGDSKSAIDQMNKAKASPLYAGDASFAKQVDDNLKKLTAGTR
jgi:tetratricopeptide (TPR) repeat protein